MSPFLPQLVFAHSVSQLLKSQDKTTVHHHNCEMPLNAGVIKWPLTDIQSQRGVPLTAPVHTELHGQVPPNSK